MENINDREKPENLQEREHILATARIVELFRQDNDFEENASLNFLSKQLELLSEEQFNLCKKFIEREYEKINISKKERPWLNPTDFFLRQFVSHDILSKFKWNKLTMILQFLLKHENIDLCKQECYYEYEKALAQTLQKVNEIQLWNLINHNQKSFNEFIYLAKFEPKIIEFIINNIQIINEEHITYIKKIKESFNYYNDKKNTIFISILWLLFLNQKRDIHNIENIFTSISDHPPFLIKAYSEDDEGPEWVTEWYYIRQLKKMEEDYLANNINKEDFIKYLTQDYLKEEIFVEGGLWIPW